MTVVAIGVAAALGALSRYGLEQILPASSDGTHYVATLVVNLSGSLVLGVLMGALADRFVQEPVLRALLTVGFLSSFTTFSALAFQTVHLAERGQAPAAAAYVLASLLGGVVLAYLGLLAGRAV
jgi:CrcB protein